MGSSLCLRVTRKNRVPLSGGLSIFLGTKNACVVLGLFFTPLSFGFPIAHARRPLQNLPFTSDDFSDRQTWQALISRIPGVNLGFLLSLVLGHDPEIS